MIEWIECAWWLKHIHFPLYTTHKSTELHAIFRFCLSVTFLSTCISNGALFRCFDRILNYRYIQNTFYSLSNQTQNGISDFIFFPEMVNLLILLFNLYFCSDSWRVWAFSSWVSRETFYFFFKYKCVLRIADTVTLPRTWIWFFKFEYTYWMYCYS